MLGMGEFARADTPPLKLHLGTLGTLYMTTTPREPVLADHVRVKQKLLPPFRAAMGSRYAPYSWTRQLVPEALWLALLIDRYGMTRAMALADVLVTAGVDALAGATAPMFAKFSAFADLPKEAKARLAANLDPSTIDDIVAALAPLTKRVADHPLAFLASARGGAAEPYAAKEASEDSSFTKVLEEVYDRQSRLAVLSMASAYGVGVRQGKIHEAPHLQADAIKSFANIVDYPNTEAAREAASMFRASASMLFMSIDLDSKAHEEDHGWVARFWAAVAGFGPCDHVDTLAEEPLDGLDGPQAFITEFRNAARQDLQARLDAWPLDLASVDSYEVIVSLLARQTTLAMELAGAPGAWTGHLAPLVLRSMADVFISLAWILKDPGGRALRFIDDGLGAIKLQIAHQERALSECDDADDRQEMEAMITLWREWLATQRLDALVEVNLGSWSGLNTRKMAEEAGFIDFYNYVYQPFSGATHSNWFHVSVHNSVHCLNPAHRLHRVAAIAPFEPDPQWLFLAAKYLRKTLTHFDETQYLTDLPLATFDFFFNAQTSDAE